MCSGCVLEKVHVSSFQQKWSVFKKLLLCLFVFVSVKLECFKLTVFFRVHDDHTRRVFIKLVFLVSMEMVRFQKVAFFPPFPWEPTYLFFCLFLFFFLLFFFWSSASPRINRDVLKKVYFLTHLQSFLKVPPQESFPNRCFCGDRRAAVAEDAKTRRLFLTWGRSRVKEARVLLVGSLAFCRSESSETFRGRPGSRTLNLHQIQQVVRIKAWFGPGWRRGQILFFFHPFLWKYLLSHSLVSKDWI